MFTITPFISNRTIPTISICAQGNRLTCAGNFCTGNHDIRTKCSNFERIRCKLTTGRGFHDNRVNARSTDIFRIVGTKIGLTCPFICISTSRNHGCGKRGSGISTITIFTNQVGTCNRDILNCRIKSHGQCVACSGSTAKTISFYLNIVCARSGQIYNERIKTETGRNLSTVHVPNIMSILLRIGHTHTCRLTRA